MDATLDTHAPVITDGRIYATLNEAGTHVSVKRMGATTRRGPKSVFVGWTELSQATREAVAAWRHADSVATYGDTWRADRADALEDAMCECILSEIHA